MDRRPGAGVLAPLAFGRAVPAFAGRNSWLGHRAWTPEFDRRNELTEALFSGSLSPGDSRALVRATGVTFLVSDCTHGADLRPVLRTNLASVRRFGCATVYELRRPGPRPRR